jgi:hypothetical protein
MFYLFTWFMMEFPDLDHLSQTNIRVNQIILFTFWDLFRWEARTRYIPFTFLHYWIYPFILLTLLALPFASLRRARWIMFGAFLGWTTHLALDGVLLFI